MANFLFKDFTIMQLIIQTINFIILLIIATIKIIIIIIIIVIFIDLVMVFIIKCLNFINIIPKFISIIIILAFPITFQLIIFV